MKTITPEMALLMVSTTAAGYLMVSAGLQKKALEWKNRRTCADCGKQLPGRSVCRCSN